jgi:hypothetical protein
MTNLVGEPEAAAAGGGSSERGEPPPAAEEHIDAVGEGPPYDVYKNHFYSIKFVMVLKIGKIILKDVFY